MARASQDAFALYSSWAHASAGQSYRRKDATGLIILPNSARRNGFLHSAYNFYNMPLFSFIYAFLANNG
jgi:hypothetical protein